MFVALGTFWSENRHSCVIFPQSVTMYRLPYYLYGGRCISTWDIVCAEVCRKASCFVVQECQRITARTRGGFFSTTKWSLSLFFSVRNLMSFMRREGCRGMALYCSNIDTTRDEARQKVVIMKSAHLKEEMLYTSFLTTYWVTIRIEIGELLQA